MQLLREEGEEEAVNIFSVSLIREYLNLSKKIYLGRDYVWKGKVISIKKPDIF